MTTSIFIGDARQRLAEIADNSVQCVVTSPPYFKLRNYQAEGQIGQEQTPQAFVSALRHVFDEVRRVLRPDGVLWLNIDDTYNAGNNYGLKHKDLLGIPWRLAFALQDAGWYLRQDNIWHKPACMPESAQDRCTRNHEYVFLFSKSERYYYNAEAISEPISTSMKDQLIRRMEHGILKQAFQTKNYEAVGVQNPHIVQKRIIEKFFQTGNVTSNKRSVWTIPNQPFFEAHFATYPEQLVETCILAGSPEFVCPACWAPLNKDNITATSVITPPVPVSTPLQPIFSFDEGPVAVVTPAINTPAQHERPSWRCPMCACDCDWKTVERPFVLDPFCGSGTTGVVARRHDRHFIGVELNPTYAKIAEQRISGDSSLFNYVDILLEDYDNESHQ